MFTPRFQVDQKVLEAEKKLLEIINAPNSHLSETMEVISDILRDGKTELDTFDRNVHHHIAKVAPDVFENLKDYVTIVRIIYHVKQASALFCQLSNPLQ